MRGLYAILVSMRTAFALFAALIAVCIAGSLMLPRHLAFFSGIDETPLFRWLEAAGDTSRTWWIYALIAIMGAMAASTVLCTLDALPRAVRASRRLLRLSPQAMHAGVLLVLLGHFLTAAYGVRDTVRLGEGVWFGLEKGLEIKLGGAGIIKDEKGYQKDWRADILLYENEAFKERYELRPVAPVSIGRYMIFYSSVIEGESPQAVIRVVRDPGAFWALVGGILVALGSVGYGLGRLAEGGDGGDT